MNHMIYRGWVQHRRLQPFSHQFKYPIYFTYCNLRTLDEIITPNGYYFHDKWHHQRWLRKDFYGDTHESLADTIARCVYQQLGIHLKGDIFQLAQPRYLGYVFNPIVLYYCYHQDQTPLAVVAEVTNTPWSEKHLYVLRFNSNGRLVNEKRMHVSPFLPMDLMYHFDIGIPGRHLRVKVEAKQRDTPYFDAKMHLQAHEISRHTMQRLRYTYPLSSYMTLWRIYFQAARLHIKGAKFHPHPRKETG